MPSFTLTEIPPHFFNAMTRIKSDKIILDDKVTILRENNEFSHEMIFECNKKYSSEYYLKELKYSLEFTIKTLKLNIEKNKIDITYQIIESDNIYNYVLETSDNL